MEESCSSPAARLKRLAKNRPDSQKIDLLTVSDVCVEKIETPRSDNKVNLGFIDISYTVQEGVFNKKKRKILDKISGDFASGELTAIMGPSGAGKTTLMNILAGYVTKGVTGKVYTNCEERDVMGFKNNSCYIMQDDKLQPLLTIQEAMTVAANLKLPSSITHKEKKNKIKEILDAMNLWQCRKTKTMSLSGGQKKKLSIALELLENPQVMFFDEPTSGLDSLASRQCVMLLKELAQTGRTIVCTIHQPSATIFNLFDHLYVLANGRIIYQGSVKGLLPYLEEENLRCPTYHNPADFLLEVANGEHGDHSKTLVQKSNNGLNQDWRRNPPQTIDPAGDGKLPLIKLPPTRPPQATDCDTDRSRGSHSKTLLYQILVLLKRTFLILLRDKTLTLNRLGTHSGIALFIGILYHGIGKDASNMLNNFNFLYFSAMFLMLTAFNCVSTTFPLQLPVIIREHFNKWYSLKSYYLAITLADIPIQIIATLIYASVTYFLTMQPVEPFRIVAFMFMCVLISLVAQSFGLFIGACMDVKNGVIFGPFCFLPFTIFSGFFVQLNDCPPNLRWLFHISFLKYGFEGLVLSVLGYERPKLPCNADYCHFVNPRKFLSEMDMENAEYASSVMFLVGLIILIRVGAYFALKIQIRRSISRKT